jgi:hypothetical protein
MPSRRAQSRIPQARIVEDVIAEVGAAFLGDQANAGLTDGHPGLATIDGGLMPHLRLKF